MNSNVKGINFDPISAKFAEDPSPYQQQKLHSMRQKIAWTDDSIQAIIVNFLSFDSLFPHTLIHVVDLKCFDFGAVAFCVAGLNVVDVGVINLCDDVMLYQWKREKLIKMTNRCQ